MRDFFPASSRSFCPRLTLSRYWQFLLYMFIALTACELALAPFTGLYSMYSVTIGYIGLSVEATLPLPQMFANAHSRSCKGFRPSVLGSWLAGDAMKMLWFFTATTEIPWAFKMCGIFQAGCDAFLGIQYVMYGSGETPAKGIPMSSVDEVTRPASNRIASRRGTPLGEKDL